MRVVGRLMALLAALLFVAILPCAAWTFGASQLLLSADTYKTALGNQDVYSDLIPALLPAVAQSDVHTEIHDPEALTLLNIVRNLDEAAWARIAANLIPAEWLRQQAESNLDAFFDWLNGRTDAPALAFDTGSLRERLSGEPGQRAVNEIIASWPVCTEEEVAVLAAYEANSGQPFPFCQPPGEYLAFVSQALSQALSQAASTLPDVSPEPGWLDDNQTRAELTQLQQVVHVSRAMTLELVLIPAALLSLVVFFTVRSLKSFGRWSGLALIVSGVFTALPIPLLLSPLLLPSAIGSLQERSGPGGFFGAAPSGETSYAGLILEGIVRSLLGELTLPVLVLAAIMLGLGFVGMVTATLARHPDEVIEDELLALRARAALAPTGLTPAAPLTPTRPDSLAPGPTSLADPPDRSP